MLLTKSLVILCAAAVATARVFLYDDIVTGGLFLGEDTSDPAADPYDVYSDPKNFATAVASISVFAGNIASFNPSDQLTSDSAYSNFKKKLFTFPGFKSTLERSNGLTFYGRYELETKVANIYDRYVYAGEGDKVAAALGDVVGDRLENDPSKNWAFTTVIIHQLEENNVQLEVLELSVSHDYVSLESMRHRQGDHAAVLNVSVYSVNNAFLQGNARTLADKISIVSVEDFVKFFTTATSSEDSLEAWLEVEQNQNSGQQTTFARRPHVLYPRM